METLDRELQRDAGMPHAYDEILVRLSEVPDRSLRMRDLAEATGSSRSRLSHVVARLEEFGWVRREDCPADRRGLVAVLTDQGFAVLTAAAPGHVEGVRRHLFDPLSPAQVDQLRRISESCSTIWSLMARHLDQTPPPLVLNVAGQARWGVSLGLGDVTTQAHARVAAGDLAGARELLDPALATADPSPAHASPELAEAAGLHARILVALGEASSARAWAAFAYSAATRLHGSDDERTIAAGALLAAVLHRVGSHARAAHLYRGVITELTAIDGPESLRVLAAHADLATVEHARGDCTVARNRLEDAWELHREVYGDGHLSGIKMLTRLGAMERDCGLVTEAGAHLALAEELCREHLAPDHPLAVQVAALASVGPDPAHCRDDRPGSGGPAAPRAAGPIGTRPPPPVPSPRTPSEGSFDDPPFSDEHVDRSEPLWPPEHPGPETADLPDPPQTPRTARPPEVYQPTGRPRQGILPIIIAGLVVVLLGTVAVVAGLTLVRGTRGNPNFPSARPPAATASAAARTTAAAPTTPAASRPGSPGAPPAGVALRDSRDSIALTWTYPIGAEDPVVISGSRAGRQPRAIQELPPGTGSYILYGLHQNTDYCFSVAVVYATDRVARSDNVCTARSGTTPRN